MTNTRLRSYVLLETMLSLLIFALAAWVCLTLFSRGADAAREADELTNASRICSSALERMRAGELAEWVGISYNSDWEEIDSADTRSYGRHYWLLAEASEEDGLVTATATVFCIEPQRESTTREEQPLRTVYRLTGGWLDPELLGEVTP